MDIDVSFLRTRSCLDHFYGMVSSIAQPCSNVSEMEIIGKSLTSVFKLFDLPGMPGLSPFFRKLSGHNKICLEVIGSIKLFFSLRKALECDAVGRTYWETRKVTEIVDLTCSIGSNLIGTVKLVSFLASVAFPASLNLWKIGLASAAFGCRGYNEYFAVQKLGESLSTFKEKQEASRKKIRETSKQLLLGKYQRKEEAAGAKIVELENALKALRPLKSFSDLKQVRAKAADYLAKIDKLNLKYERYEKYIFALKFKTADRFRELKQLKWSNRVERCAENLKNKTDSRDFYCSFAASLALGLISTLFAVQNVVILTGLGVMSVAISALGIVRLVDKPAEKIYEII